MSLASRLASAPNDAYWALSTADAKFPDDHAVDRRGGHGLVRPVPRAAGHPARAGGSRGRVPRAARDLSTHAEHLRDAVQRRLPARLVPGPRARLREHARSRASRRQHPDVGRREPDRDDARRRRTAAPLPPPAAQGARRAVVSASTTSRFRSSRSTRNIQYDEVLDWIVAAVEPLGAEYPGADARRVCRAVDRRLRERGQAVGRLLGAGVRHAPVHAAELHRHAGRRVHAGARDGALDAHHPVARGAAVRLFELHDLRRRSAVDAERGAAARIHAEALDRSGRADRPAAARDRQHHRHVLHPGDVRRLRAARASSGRTGSADHVGDPDRDVHARC